MPRRATDIRPHISAQPLVCSRFRVGPDYTNWRPDGSGDWLLLQTVSGAGQVGSGDQFHRIGPGQAVLFAIGAEQDYGTAATPGHWVLRWAHFQPRPHWRPWLYWAGRQLGVAETGPPGPDNPIDRALERMILSHRFGDPAAIDLAMNALEEALIRIAQAETGRLEGMDPRVRHAMQAMAAIERPLKLADLAAACGLSESRFSHLFKQETGTTPQRYREQLRLDHGKLLLTQTSMTVGEVAAACGYDDVLYFIRRFRVVVGTPPGAWRKNSGKEPPIA